MFDCWQRRFLRLIHRLDFLPSPPRSGSRRKRRRRLKNYVKRCIFAGLMFHSCGCDIAIDTSIAGDGYQLRDSMTTEGLLHPLAASFTVFVGAGPSSMAPVSVRASMEMEFFPDRIPESVYLIYPTDPDRGPIVSQPPLAAAFVLKVSAPKDPGRSNLFLVTARHVVDTQWAHCAGKNPSSVALRLNRRTGGVGYVTVLLKSDSEPTFLTSLDPAVDLALIPLNGTVIANLSDYKLFEFSSNDLLNSADLPFLRNDLPIRTAGYPASFAQGQVRYPIRNMGSISEMRDDVTEIPCKPDELGPGQNQVVQDEAGHSLRHLWFINAGATEGLIGAPVFVDLERFAGEGRTRMLLGIQSNNWSQKGLVGITPSYLLGDIVRSVLSREASEQTFLQGSIKRGNQRKNNRKKLTKSR